MQHASLRENGIDGRIGAIILGGCFLLAMVSIAQHAVAIAHAGQPIPWRGLALARFTDWYSCGLLVPAFYVLARHCPLHAPHWPRTAAVYISASFVAAALKIVLFGSVGNYFRPGQFPIGDLLIEDMIPCTISFLVIAGLVHAHLFVRDRRASEERVDTVPPPGGEAIASHAGQRFTIQDSGGLRLLAASQIDWIDAQGNYVRLHSNGARHLIRNTMAGIEEQLDPRLFVRVHRSAIVNIDRIERIERLSHGQYRLLLHGGAIVRSGRRYNANVRRLIA